MISEFSKTALQFVVPGPRTHVDDVFENQPSRFERARIPHDFHRGRSTGLVPGRGALGAGVVPALGRRQQDVYRTGVFLEFIYPHVLQSAGHHVSIREVRAERRRRRSAHVDAGDDVDTSRTRPGAAAARAAEEVASTHHVTDAPAL